MLVVELTVINGYLPAAVEAVALEVVAEEGEEEEVEVAAAAISF